MREYLTLSVQGHDVLHVLERSYATYGTGDIPMCLEAQLAAWNKDHVSRDAAPTCLACIGRASLAAAGYGP